MRVRPLLGGLAAGALLLAGCSQGNVFDLSVGDCFDQPADLDQVTDVELVDCEEPHELEVFASVTLDDGDYPGTQEMFAVSEERCVEEFESYVGRDYASSRLAVGTFVPSEDTWRAGDREATCFLGDLGGEPLTGSMQGSGE